MEKREHTRYAIWFPVTLDVNSAPLFAVCHDASVGGILISGTTKLDIGVEVAVKFRVRPSDPEQTVLGRIVRMKPRDDDPRIVWPFQMAIEFAHPVPELERQLRRVSEAPPSM